MLEQLKIINYLSQAPKKEKDSTPTEKEEHITP